MRRQNAFPDKYLTCFFAGGSETSAGYKAFETAYKQYLSSICRKNRWQLTRFLKSHYEFSCFIRSGNKCVYLSISDVRYWKDQWYEHILIRPAKDETDFRGGQNHYTDISHIEQDIEHLFALVSF